jgi:hypothetical protein
VLIALGAGAVGSLGLMLRAGRHAPLFLIIVFALWVLAPFAGAAWVTMASTRWSPLGRTTVYVVSLAVAVLSVAAYASVVLRPPRSTPAFVFVVVPAASWWGIGISVAIVALSSRRGQS